MPAALIAFFATLAPLLAIDGIWLAVMAKRFYAPRLGGLMLAAPHLVPAAAFYIVYTAGLSLFVVMPALQRHSSVVGIFFMGAIFGLVAYATYDLTNQATLKDWPIAVTLVDLAWGALLSGTVSLIALVAARFFA